MLDLPPRYLDMLIPLFKKHIPEYEVLAFGSRVKGKSHDTSDLDLVVYKGQNPLERCPQISDLKDAITESNIPILVDILDWATIPQDFRDNILQNYHKIF